MSATVAHEPALVLERRTAFVVARFGQLHDTASWAIVGGGRRQVRAVVWHEVRNAELPASVDPRALLEERLASAGLEGAVGMLTSRDLRACHRADVERDGLSATAVVTAGLGNALRVGDPAGTREPLGTINILCRVSVPLTEEAMLEACSLVVEARTLAVLEAGLASIASSLDATGTGTDCVVVASPVPSAEQTRRPYAGKHTVLGELVGRATLAATREAVATWRLETQR